MSLTPDNLSPASEEELSAKHLPLTELESLIARPSSWRRRGVQSLLPHLPVASQAELAAASRYA